MPSSTSDFLAKIAAQVGSTSGAIFKTAANVDGSTQVLRAPSATGAVVWTILYPRVIYSFETDVVAIGDGSGMTTESATAFVAGLN